MHSYTTFHIVCLFVSVYGRLSGVKGVAVQLVTFLATPL